MEEKYTRLISFLSKQNDVPISSNALSLKLDVSSRTIKNYVSEINSIYPGLIIPTTKGYVLSESIYKSIDDLEKKSIIPQNSKERIVFLIKQFMELDKDDTLSIFDVADSLYISESTLRRDLLEIKNHFSEYKLNLTISNNQIIIEGKEKNKRHLMNKLFTDEILENKYSIEQIQVLFPDYDVQRIKSIVLEKCRDFNYLVNGFTVDKIVLDIVIQIERITNSFSTESADNIVNFNVHEKVLAREITYEFEKLFNIKYSESEIEAFTIILFTYLLKIDYQKITTQDLQSIVGNEVYELSKQIIEDSNDYFLKNQNQEFFTRFTLHLYNLLLRARTNYINQNLMTDSIRNSCPMLFDCAVNISNTIFEKTGFQINDDEIAYIAIHIGGMLEDEGTNKLNCILVFPSYYNMAETIYEKLNNQINSQANLTLSNSNLIDNIDSYDLVITNDPYIKAKPEKVQLISGILSDKDVSKIKIKLEEIKRNKDIELLINHLMSITSGMFFYKNLDVKNGEECIKYISNELYDKGIVNKDYLDNVMHRESISSTAFNRIAVPHTLKMNSNKTIIAIASFDKPIDWFGKNIDVVFQFAIQECDKKIFHFVFDHLVSLLLDDININLIKNCNTYKELIDTIPLIREI